ncbi:SART-1 protein [Phyllosticta citriasiana]|uniref:SART-1 protein n=1 Tax=Phyllosticta citriasiana TaxID=595635 RepID=A0ABR1KP95_9PEZI
MADAISIEEANKIRVAMGMKPLPVPGQEAPSGPVFQESKGSDSDEEPASTLETRTEASYGNWNNHLAEQEAKAKATARKEAVKKAREQAQRFAQLEGKGLGDGDDVDAKTWLAGQKKRQKKIEKLKKLEQELAEREAQAQAEYTAADLAGVKVGHELDQFGEGEEHILTLKDAAVDDEEAGDELEAVNIRDTEKVNERLESKKRKRAYDPNNLDDDAQGTILAQYDEEIDGKKRKLFTLDGQGRTKEEAERSAAGDATGPSRSIKISLDLLKDESTPASDYVDPSQVKVKKPKKKKEKKSRKKALDDDDIFPTPEAPDAGAMEVDLPESKPAPKKISDDNFVDDEDLQAQLALQRRQALKKRKKVKPEDLARQIREEASATPGVVDSTETPEEEPGLVIDETTEFVANLQGPAERPQRQRSKSAQPTRRASEPNEIDDEGDTNMEQSYAEVEDEAERQARAERSASAVADITTTGLDEEEIVERGVGATLKLLRQRGQVKDSNGQELNENFVGHQRFIAERNKAMVEAEQRAKLQRERDRRSGRMEHMSAREREALAQKANQDRDRIESKRMAEIFNKEYKPNVDLKYVDEFGRHMNQKEAFKHLSHQFHGKGSGKQKTEKRLKKIEEEKKREAMSSLDSSQHTSMNTAMDATARKNRAAGIRLE